MFFQYFAEKVFMKTQEGKTNEPLICTAALEWHCLDFVQYVTILFRENSILGDLAACGQVSPQQNRYLIRN